MSERAVMTTWMFGGQSSLYIHGDRVEVGTTDVVFNENLARVTYRDARELVAWTSSRRWHFWCGIVLALLGLPSVAALAAGATGELVAVSVVGGITCLAVCAPLIYMGRPGGITRFLLDGVRGHVEGVLSGSRRKREALLAEIERRIHTRQSTGDGRN